MVSVVADPAGLDSDGLELPVGGYSRQWRARLRRGLATAVGVVFVFVLPLVTIFAHRKRQAVEQLPARVHADLRAAGAPYITLSQIPTACVNAFVDVQGPDFWQNRPASDLAAMIQPVGLLSRRVRTASATVAEQLVQHQFLQERPSLERQTQEIILTLLATHTYSTAQILEMYLNQVYLGDGAVGVAAGAETYFGRTVSALAPGQCDLLAGLSQAPHPNDLPLHATARQRAVLDRMVQARDLTSKQATSIAEQPLDLLQPESVSGKSPPAGPGHP